MTTLTTTALLPNPLPLPAGASRALRVGAAFGVLWNLFGVYQLVGSLTRGADDPMRAGLTPEQVAVYASLPSWINLAFAVGVFGGLVGSVALFARRAVALPVLAFSLVGYLVLFAGDVWFGVFAAVPQQLAILAFVVAVAAALFAAAAYARRNLVA